MTYRAHLDGTPVEVEVGTDALRIGGEEFAWVDMDDVVVDGWSVTMNGPGRSVTISQLGRQRDDLLNALRLARLPARRAAMLQSGADSVIASFDAQVDDRAVLVSIHADGITIEGDVGAPTYLPLSLLDDVVRDGYRITLRSHLGDGIVIAAVGRRTDELLARLEEARSELAEATRAGYAALDPALESLPAPDGWAIDRARAGGHWPALRSAFGDGARAEEVDHLEQLAGDGLRLGIKAAFRSATLPFALAPRGGRVAVEGTGSEARATFVFATDDVDRLNAALLCTSFRREALYLPEAELGRWAVAARQIEVVRWAREALVARIVHDGRWAANVSAALEH